MDSDAIIRAYCRLYSKAQLEEALREALANFSSGVVVTNVSWEGGSTGGQLSGKSEELIPILEACLERKENPTAVVAKDDLYYDFSARRTGT